MGAVAAAVHQFDLEFLRHNSGPWECLATDLRSEGLI